jgi:hypothetical protein
MSSDIRRDMCLSLQQFQLTGTNECVLLEKFSLSAFRSEFLCRLYAGTLNLSASLGGNLQTSIQQPPLFQNKGFASATMETTNMYIFDSFLKVIPV